MPCTPIRLFRSGLSQNTGRAKTKSRSRTPTKRCAKSLNPSHIHRSKASKPSSRTRAIEFPRLKPPIQRISWTRVCSKSWIAPDTSMGYIDELQKLECWSNGVLEYWEILAHHSNTPSFHYPIS